MKILFVAMSASIHTARCINQISNLGWDIRLFDSTDTSYINPELRNVTVYHTFHSLQTNLDPSVISRGFNLRFEYRAVAKEWILEKQPNYRVRRLARLIQQFQPDIIHSLEFQHSGYMMLETREWLKSQGVTDFPTWMIFSWGSDIYLFNRMEEHKQRISELLQQADYFECECQRDALTAKLLGMKALQLPLLPAPGGIDLQQATKLRYLEKTSSRRTIAFRGYQNWAGRALFGLRALESCIDLLKDYEIVMYSPSSEEDMRIAATLFTEKTGIPIEVLSPLQPHDTILELFARSRIFIGVSISDGISYSMLEAMSLGTFPIQSNTACADEWLVHGETGFIVPPEDSQAIAVAIRRALSDDTLVDQAAELNAKVCAERLDREKIRQQVIDTYAAIMENRHK